MNYIMMSLIWDLSGVTYSKKIQLTAQQNCLSGIVQFPAQTGTSDL